MEDSVAADNPNSAHHIIYITGETIILVPQVYLMYTIDSSSFQNKQYKLFN